MKYLLLLLLTTCIYAADTQKKAQKYSVDVIPKKMTVQEKKARFRALFVPSIQKVHSEWMQRYLQVAKDIRKNKNTDKIKNLKTQFKASSDEDLLMRLKPHPVSIALAQAAMESSWGTSRFFREGINPFGMWSSNPHEPRIAAGKKRGKRTIWLKKFSSIDDAIRAYYKTMATGRAYKKFRQLRLKHNDPFKITPGLDKYSEIGQAYIKEINQVIRYNKFTKYDKY